MGDIKYQVGPVLQCLVDIGFADAADVFSLQIESAKELGLMPSDYKVSYRTMEKLGIVAQNNSFRKDSIENGLKRLQDLEEDSIVFIQLYNYDRKLYAYRKSANGFASIGDEVTETIMKRPGVNKVFLYLPSKASINPYPAKQGDRKPEKVKDSICHETNIFQPFQPNPRKRSANDCVVRALAGALDISWEMALDILALSRNVRVNHRDNYFPVFEYMGFIHKRTISKNGRLYKGNEFCGYLDSTFSDGETIIARLGKGHVSAVVPMQNRYGENRYKVMDSWDSSGNTVFDFWIVEKPLGCL